MVIIDLLKKAEEWGHTTGVLCLGAVLGGRDSSFLILLLSAVVLLSQIVQKRQLSFQQAWFVAG